MSDPGSNQLSPHIVDQGGGFNDSDPNNQIGSGGSGFDLKKTLQEIAIALGTAFVTNRFGGETGAESQLREVSTAPFLSNTLQGFLPPSLRFGRTGPILESGIQGIGELIANPGKLSANVGDAIRQRLATTSEGIATDFRGIGAQQQGRAARSNQPGSIKSALASALDVAQSRAQRGARRDALVDTDRLRRDDLGQTFNILDAILQFQSSGRGQAIPGLSAAAGLAQNRQASNIAAIGDFLSSAGSRNSRNQRVGS